MLKIKLLKALNGDSIIISYGEEKTYNILIDGGCGKLCYRQLCRYMEDMKKEKNVIDLVVLTHIDSDHIEGILRLFSQKEFDFSIIKEMWFNFGEGLQNSLKIEGINKEINLYDFDTKISWKQGRSLEERLQDTAIQRRSFLKVGDSYFIGDARITILSPTIDTLNEFVRKEIEESKQSAKIASSYDYQKGVLELNETEFEGIVSLTNKSSIAFLFELGEIKLLLLGDAEAATIEDSLSHLGYSRENKLKVDYCKIAHHASRHNTSGTLIQMLDCKNYIISTKSTTQGRPSKECLSRIICNSTTSVSFYCNYDINANDIFTEDEFSKYGMKFITVDENGIDVEENKHDNRLL